jgi:methionine-rich copper-binding protein CopC
MDPGRRIGMTARQLAAATALVALMAAPAAAWHNRLTKSVPAKDEGLATAPTSIRLWFAEKPTPAFSSVTLAAADSTRIPVAKPAATDDTLSIAADIERPLGPGTYLVTWRTAGDDGHAVRGRFTFTVRP